MLLKLFRVTVADADNGNLKSPYISPYILYKMFEPRVSEIWTKS